MLVYQRVDTTRNFLDPTEPRYRCLASKPMRSDARTLSPPRAEMVPAKLPSMAFFVATQCSFPAWSRVWKSTWKS